MDGVIAIWQRLRRLCQRAEERQAVAAVWKKGSFVVAESGVEYECQVIPRARIKAACSEGIDWVRLSGPDGVRSLRAIFCISSITPVDSFHVGPTSDARG